MDRSLKELYQIVLDNFQFNYGICNNIVRCYMDDKISLKENTKLSLDLQQRRPSFFSKFYWNKSYHKLGNAFWWPINNEGNEQRIKFLKHLINKL